MKIKTAALSAAAGLALLCAAPAFVSAQEQDAGSDVTFRGGWAGLVHDRGGQVFTDVGGSNGEINNGHGGYYVGAALDMLLSRDAWGLLKDLWAQGEVGLEFKRFDSNTVTSATNALTGLGGKYAQVPVTMLTVDVAPKLRWAGWGRFQPWIIPAGMDFHVISPPSNLTSYLDVGVESGIGADYRIWKQFKVGVEARYHVAAGETGTMNNFGTVGSYASIAF